MKKLTSSLFFANILFFILCQNTIAEIRIVRLSDQETTYDFAGKLCWNPNGDFWEKQIVVYNDSPEPPTDHYVWSYVSGLTPPDRDGYEDWESLYYEPFYITESCIPRVPLQQNDSWKIDFNDNSIGIYSNNDLLSDWNCPKSYVGHNQIEIISDNNAYEGKSIRINYPKNKYGCDGYCVNWKVDLGEKYEKLYCSYRIKFPIDFDFVRGGKLPGLAGGEANTGGDKPDGKDGWSARIMWRSGGTFSQYVYHPDQPSKYGQHFEWNMEPIEKGNWHQIQTFISMNTPGKKDGIIQSWLNGSLVLDQRDIRFRDIEDLSINIFRFASFFGGGDSSWAPSKDQHLYLDDFIISKNVIIEENNNTDNQENDNDSSEEDSSSGCFLDAIHNENPGLTKRFSGFAGSPEAAI